MVPKGSQTQGDRIPYKHAEDPTPFGKATYASSSLSVDADRYEVDQSRVRLIKHPEGAVLGSNQVGPHLGDVTEHAWEVDIDLDEQHRLNKGVEAFRIGDASKRHEWQG